MKKKCKIAIIVLLIMLILITKSYAHDRNITGWNNRNSHSITYHNGIYYGYHHEAGVKPRVLSEGLGRIEVTLNRVHDGDTARFSIDGEIIRARFLGIDTPEMERGDRPAEPWAIEATKYVINALENATIIEIEYDENARKLDFYDRHLVWVWIDGELLQERLLLNGLAETFWLRANYRYADVL